MKKQYTLKEREIKLVDIGKPYTKLMDIARQKFPERTGWTFEWRAWQDGDYKIILKSGRRKEKITDIFEFKKSKGKFIYKTEADRSRKMIITEEEVRFNKPAFKDGGFPSIEELSYGHLLRHYGIGRCISYRDARAQLGRLFHITKPQSHVILKSLRDRGLLVFGNRGFQLVMPNGGGFDA